MSVEPVTPTEIYQTTQTWLQKHEKIIIVLLVLLAGSWLGNHWLNIKADDARQLANVAEQQLNNQKAKDVQLASQVSQLNTQYQNVVSQLSAQNAQLAAAVTSRTVVLQQQQATDKTMPLLDLGNRWAALAGIAPTELRESAAGITVSDTGARQTVEQLEQVPVLTKNLRDETTIADGREQEIDKANALVGGLTQQVSGLNLTISDDAKVCKAQIASVKADARKSKSKWFKVGVVVGFVGGLFIGHSIP